MTSLLDLSILDFTFCKTLFRFLGLSQNCLHFYLLESLHLSEVNNNFVNFTE